MLGHRRVYIVPSRLGLFFGGTLAILLVGSINYVLSLGFALTFLLAGMGLAAIVQTTRNLARLSVRAGRYELVLGYNPDRQRELLSLLGVKGADWLELTSALFAVLGAFVLDLFAWMLRGMVRPDPVQKSWNQFCRKLGAKGVTRSPHEGPRDFSERAARSLPFAQESIQRIAALYMGLRYGRQAAAEDVVELRQRFKDLRFG